MTVLRNYIEWLKKNYEKDNIYHEILFAIKRLYKLSRESMLDMENGGKKNRKNKNCILNDYFFFV